MNRWIIFILLLLILYGIYRYQQYLQTTTEKEIKDENKNISNNQNKKKKEDNESVSTENISQFSLNSEEDSKSASGGYKLDSMLESTDSKDNLSFVDNLSQISSD